jgi:Na+-transporting methylmalonyl-CoA/oxaloacetate decarboxylase beta subunit
MKSILAILNFTAAGILSLLLLLPLIFIYSEPPDDAEISCTVIGGAEGPTAVFIANPYINIFIVLLIALLLYNAVFILNNKTKEQNER